MNRLFAFIRLLLDRRRLITAMAAREIRAQYVGSSLGLLWTLIHPIVMIAVFWFVFGLGFRAKPVSDVPFVVWLTAGLAPWFLFSEIVNGSTNIVVAHAHLIKKTIFYPQILPFVKICSALVIHLIFITILLLLIFFQKVAITFWVIQIGYYLLCLLVLSLGLSWMFSALNVFIRDVAQLVSVTLQVGFWLTPIFWDINMMSPKIQWFLKFNPVYYIILGYRDSFISGRPFWSRPVYMCYFWFCALTLLFLGAYVFKRLKPQFPDVL
ncbi:MAG: ABC transporter permease [Candidatus Electrothrix sp. AR5]|nr:ABC transporter permease [Candidatus Electrothrix sp. AR5]